MKNKITYIIATIIFSIFAIFFLNNTSYAGTQSLNNLTYDVELNEDGSVDVTETWDITVTNTNTLFKTFDLDSSKYSRITNVTVSEITDSGRLVQFRDTKEYAYHVEKDGFYALQINMNEFEIAWGVSISNNERKTYKISYKIQDAIKTYNDCSEFYWQFIGTSNAIPARKVVGTIKLPKEVSKKENLKVWAHGPLNGEITIVDNKTVKFEVLNLSSKTMVEARVAVIDKIFTLNRNLVNSNKLNSIIQEETEWADEANRIREKQLEEEERIESILKIIVIIIAIIIITVLIIFILKIIKYIKELLRIQKLKPEEEIQYYRDIPDENVTPAEASFLYYFDKKNSFKKNLSKIVSATMLNLALKKIISFEEKDGQVEINLNENADISKLKYDESAIYSILTEANDYKNRNEENTDITVTMKDIEKYAKKHDKQFLSKIEGIKETAKGFNELKGNYDEKINKSSKKWSNKSLSYGTVAFVCLSFSALVVPVFFIIPSIICAVLCSKIEKKTRTLTQKGINEQEKWKGLKRYMENFSLLDEREVPELALWEKYLVYATAFGIADKVLEQLKIKYPEIMDENYFANNTYSYIYMINRINFNRAITAGVNKAYSAGLREKIAREASSSGSFSSRRRPEVEAFLLEAGGRWPEDGRNGWKIKI